MYQWGTAHAVRNERLGTGTSSRAADFGTSYSTLGTTGFAWEYFLLSFSISSGVDALVNIGIDTGGNVWPIVENLRVCTRTGAAGHGSGIIGFPIHVPAGAALVGKCSAGTSPRGTLHGFSTGPNGAPGFSRAVALYTPSSDRGVSVDAGGSINTKTRTEIIASTPYAVAGLLCSVGPAADTSRSSNEFRFDIEMGASGQEQVIAADLAMHQDAQLDNPYPPLGVFGGIIPCLIPAGSRLSVNAACNTTTAGDRTFDFAPLGFVP